MYSISTHIVENGKISSFAAVSIYVYVLVYVTYINISYFLYPLVNDHLYRFHTIGTRLQ